MQTQCIQQPNKFIEIDQEYDSVSRNDMKERSYGGEKDDGEIEIRLEPESNYSEDESIVRRKKTRKIVLIACGKLEQLILIRYVEIGSQFLQ